MDKSVRFIIFRSGISLLGKLFIQNNQIFFITEYNNSVECRLSGTRKIK